VHGTATLLFPLLAAEKSRVPFYVAGGLLASWAVIVSVVLGLRHVNFPGSLGGQRTVLAITAVLVVATIAAAVATSSSPAKKAAQSAAASATPTAGTSSAAPASPTSTRTSVSPGHGHAKATTGTPAPPSSPARTGGASSVALAADPNGLLSFDTKQLSAKAGSVTIKFTNAATLEHNVTIVEGAKRLGATPTFVTGSRTLTLTLKSGTYTFYCSVPGHRQGGMEGTLSVT
jgi:plastocyanin